MKAGPLRHRISCDEPLITESASGEEVVTFPDYLSFDESASIEPLTGRERDVSNQKLAEMDTRIGMRWSPRNDRITAKWRLRHNGIAYNIISIAHIDLGMREIQIMAKSGLIG